MTIDLSQLPEPRLPDSPDEPPSYDFYRESRRAVSLEYGPWRAYSTRASDHERDALLQELALYLLEHPRWAIDRESGELLAREQRQAYLRQTLRHIARDGRGWIDSLDGRETLRARPRKANLTAVKCESVREQAERYREHERSRRAAPFTSLDVTTDDGDNDGGRGWLEIAEHREREREAGEQLPPVALAAHSPELCDRMTDAIVDALAARGVSVGTVAHTNQIRIALLMAGGERLSDIAAARGIGIATAKRRSAAGAELLRAASDWINLVSIRRACVAAMLEEDRTICPDAWLPQSVAEVDAQLDIGAMRAVVDGAISEQRRRTALLMAGGERRQRAETVRVETVTTAHGRAVSVRYGRRPSGSAADVLAYIGRLERALDRPRWTLDTTGAVAVTEPPRSLRVLSSATGPMLPTWKPPPVSLTGSTPEQPSPRAWLWPDALFGGQAAYSREHPARRCSARWTWSEHKPPARSAEPCGLGPDWKRTVTEQRSRDALTVARRIARNNGTRSRRVVALLKLALTVIPD